MGNRVGNKVWDSDTKKENMQLVVLQEKLELSLKVQEQTQQEKLAWITENKKKEVEIKGLYRIN